MAFGVYLLLTGNGIGVMVLLAAVFSMLVVVIGRHWIPFAVALMTAAGEVFAAHGPIISVAYCAMGVQLLWALVLALAIAGVPSVPAYVFLLFAGYWTLNVPSTIVHLAAAGTAASWYFVTHEENPTGQAVRRAMTSSFGTVCFGSLAVAFVSTIKLLLRSSSAGRSSMAGGAGGGGGACGPLLGLLEVYNHYSYTQVAIYGYSYRDAGRASFALLKRVGLLPLLNNMVIAIVLLVGKLLAGAVAAGIGVALAIVGGLHPAYDASVVGAICFMVGYQMVQPLTEAISAVISAVFICFAQNPYVLQLNHPALYEAISDGYEVMTGYPYGEDEYDFDEDEEEDQEEERQTVDDGSGGVIDDGDRISIENIELSKENMTSELIPKKPAITFAP
jgi:hypothetical protein